MDRKTENLKAHKGRGTLNAALSRRFNMNEYLPDPDWMDEREEIDGPLSRPKTTVTDEYPKSILSFNQSPDLPFDRSVNAYRGCEHGCIYCYARPTHAYHDLSPGLDFETRLFAKPDAAKLLRQTLARKSYKADVIAIGTNTDPYQPIEDKYHITRQILDLMLETKHPIVITTKSARILNDIDLLEQLAEQKLTGVAISVTSLDPKLSRILEPRASTPENRLLAAKILSDAGVYVHINIAPIIPAINDHEIEAIARRVSETGAKSMSWIPLRLPHEVAPIFQEWLDTYFPDRANKVMNIIRDIRGGKDNDPNFFGRMRGQGIWAELIRTRMRMQQKKYGLTSSKWHVRRDLFRPPSTDGQMSLFA